MSEEMIKVKNYRMFYFLRKIICVLLFWLCLQNVCANLNGEKNSKIKMDNFVRDLSEVGAKHQVMILTDHENGSCVEDLTF